MPVCRRSGQVGHLHPDAALPGIMKQERGGYGTLLIMPVNAPATGMIAEIEEIEPWQQRTQKKRHPGASRS